MVRRCDTEDRHREPRTCLILVSRQGKGELDRRDTSVRPVSGEGLVKRQDLTAKPERVPAVGPF